MSIHGGFIGGIIALVLFARRRGRSIADVFDFTAPLPAPGLFFGRMGNFINGELWGKPTTLPWGFVVDPRHVFLSGEQCVLGVRALRDYAMHSARARVAALRGVPRRHRALHRDVVVGESDSSSIH
jgi:prolipoprotein diacylglyceryltransferase